MKVISSNLLLVVLLSSVAAEAAPTTIIPPQPPQPAAAPVQQANSNCAGNQNNIYDPRVPPAGAYVVKQADGSTNNLYTTGEKKPYYVDNYCTPPTAAAQTDVLLQPSTPTEPTSTK